jgi:hypothetical protein
MQPRTDWTSVARVVGGSRYREPGSPKFTKCAVIRCKATSAKVSFSDLTCLQDVRGNTTHILARGPAARPRCIPPAGREIENRAAPIPKGRTLCKLRLRAVPAERDGVPSLQTDSPPDFDCPARGEASGRRWAEGNPKLSRAHPTVKKAGFPGIEEAAADPAVTNLWKERCAGISPGRATCYG